MKLPWFCHQTEGNHFATAPPPPFVTALVPGLFFGRKSAEGSKVIVTLLLPQMAEHSDTPSTLLGENE